MNQSLYFFEIDIILETLQIFICSVQLTILLFEIKSIKQMGNYISESFFRIIVYISVIIFIYVSFAIFANNMWGQYQEKFLDLSSSIYTIMLFSIGMFI